MSKIALHKKLDLLVRIWINRRVIHKDAPMHFSDSFGYQVVDMFSKKYETVSVSIVKVTFLFGIFEA